MDRRPVRCIVADDHAATRQGASEILSAQGDIEVVATASDGPEAIHLISHYHPDVAVVDVLMPGKGGLDVVRDARTQGSPTAVVIYTGLPDPEVMRTCAKAGAAGFVLKSAPAEELLRAVRTVAGGDTYLDHARAPATVQPPPEDRTVLSARERQVLQLLANGATNDEAAQSIGLSPATVRTYVENAMHKLKADSRTHAVALAVRLGLID